MQADKKYSEAMFYVLNKIKKELLFEPDHKQIVDYSFNVNIKVLRGGFSMMEERAILQTLRNDGIVFDIGEMIVSESGYQDTTDYEVYEVYHFRVSEGFNDYYDRFQRIQNVTQNYCWFDNSAFYLTLRDGSVKTISFDTERNSRQVLALFQTVIEHWKKNGDEPILGSEIVKSMARFGSKVDSIKLKNIISNVRNKKIKPAGLEDKIHIEHDRKANGWRIDIKR